VGAQRRTARGHDSNALLTRSQLRHRRCRRGNRLCRAEPGRTVILELDDDDDIDDIYHEQPPGTSATYELLIDGLLWQSGPHELADGFGVR
jgi:hypothetical protein